MNNEYHHDHILQILYVINITIAERYGQLVVWVILRVTVQVTSVSGPVHTCDVVHNKVVSSILQPADFFLSLYKTQSV